MRAVIALVLAAGCGRIGFGTTSGGPGDGRDPEAGSRHRQYDEPVADNEYLAGFYRDTARYWFAIQVYLLNRRFQSTRRSSGAAARRSRITIYEDSILAKMLAKTPSHQARAPGCVIPPRSEAL